MLVRFARGQRGAAAVEFAMICLPLIVLLVGTIEFGRVLHLRNNLAYAADVGVRAMIIGKPDEEVAALVNAAFSGAGELTPQFGNTAVGTAHFRTLTVTYSVSLLIPGLSPDGFTLEIERGLPG
ncbi:pilus assembly protein [Pelagibacterium sp. H642]|uniref:TadE/TadG family type IV pilus assembly protein n=1 Tax=Pelagibacterium sp. H642 TaxID=1881069 RepID=UPI0028164188|nr:pilus assembly protein [Pelagibacterium sp. H642]WMT92871.1 pilus assembly protein [Pelagibacterium sp. H642]